VNAPLLRLSAGALGLGSTLWLLHGIDLPVSRSFDDSAVLVVAGIRFAALAAGWYLAALLAVGVAARLARARPLVRLADGLTLPPLRRALDAALGLSVLAGATTPAAAWAEPRATSPPVTMVRLADEPASVEPVPSTSTTTLPVPAPPSPVAHAPPPSAAGQWTVAPGDHFWSIAERVLAQAWARAPADAEVDPYWRRLVEANRHMLADRHNPDLLFVGQVLEVPPP
jgi:nucleoid-associated protein YgaU